jgi:hypothetical protein
MKAKKKLTEQLKQDFITKLVDQLRIRNTE